MKKLFRLLLTIGLLSAAAYLVRYKLLPPAQPVAIPPPQFRRPVTSDGTPSSTVTAPGQREDEPVDDLKVVKGIGPVFEQRLNDAGIASLGGLVRSDAATVAEQLEVSEAQVADWIRQARGLVY
ncbi:MAG: hypothetical protein HKN07_03350 [Acidimicrobiia bacterium]|nr:hypothetical protein [Acidimicrobiia bacterium]NNF63270.1 hypothetical protein [Acidimicrobiia bacterium]